MSTATHLATPLIPIPAHWQGYFQRRWEAENFPAEAVPFHGTSVWAGLSEQEKNDLAWGLVQINCEVIIHLEQTLLLATRELARRGLRLSPGMQEFVSDELLHIAVFRDFLEETPELSWRKGPLLLHRRLRLRRWSYWLFRWEPLAVFLTGAKSEIYAVQYHQVVKRQGGAASRWSALLHHHAVDEATHISEDFQLLREALTKATWWERRRLDAATVGSVLLTQLCLWYCTWALMRRVFPDRGVVGRVVLALRFAHWVLWRHPAYPASRRIFTRLLKKESGTYFKRFAWLGW